MTFHDEKRSAGLVCKGVIFTLLIPALMLQSCTKEKYIYTSNCNAGITFKRVAFTQLINNIQQYDHQYVEVYGTYEEGNEESALFNDSLFVDHSAKHAIWINFSQDCPLYLSGTHIGLFEYNDGKFTRINNKSITIRGKIDIHYKGHSGNYKGSMERISLVKL